MEDKLHSLRLNHKYRHSIKQLKIYVYSIFLFLHVRIYFYTLFTLTFYEGYSVLDTATLNWFQIPCWISDGVSILELQVSPGIWNIKLWKKKKKIFLLLCLEPYNPRTCPNGAQYKSLSRSSILFVTIEENQV